MYKRRNEFRMKEVWEVAHPWGVSPCPKHRRDNPAVKTIEAARHKHAFWANKSLRERKVSTRSIIPLEIPSSAHIGIQFRVSSNDKYDDKMVEI